MVNVDSKLIVFPVRGLDAEDSFQRIFLQLELEVTAILLTGTFSFYFGFKVPEVTLVAEAELCSTEWRLKLASGEQVIQVSTVIEGVGKPLVVGKRSGEGSS